MSEVGKLPRTDVQRCDSPRSPAPHAAGIGFGRRGGVVVRRTSQGGLCAAVRAGRARVGAGGSFLPTGEEKQIHFSAFQRKGVNFF